MENVVNIVQWIFGFFLILSSLGVIIARKPLYSCLSFLLSLILLAALYAELSAHFMAVLQILVYAGAILVIFVFIIVLFQDAHQQIARINARSRPFLLSLAAITFLLALVFFGSKINHLPALTGSIKEFGTAQSLGRALYVDFFFPFEAIIPLFLVAIIGSLYIAKKES